MTGQKIILASTSPRRSQLLKEWGIKFEIVPSDCDEKTALKKPSYIVQELALRKALSAAKKVKEGLVIGADTIVAVGTHIIGKPENHDHSHKILEKLNGSYHKVYTGVAVIDACSGKKIVSYDVSRVKMRKFQPEEIKKFAGKHMDKAGAYAVQETEDAFVEKIEGDYFNVVGLPFYKLKEVLSNFGIKIAVNPNKKP